MKTNSNKRSIVGLAVMIALSVILLPILIINLTLIIKGNIDPSVPPDVFGIAPLAVTSGSMDGDEPDSFSTGALIFVEILSDEEKAQLSEGDIVTFHSGDSYVTHRIVAVNTEGGRPVSVITKGDANNVNDGAIPLSNIVGKCVGSVGGLGSFSMFLQTPGGILVFVGIPVLAFIGYDILRITLYNRRVRAEEAAAEKGAQLEDKERELREKEEELARLRAIVEAQGGKGSDAAAPPARAEGGEPSCPSDGQDAR